MPYIPTDPNSPHAIVSHGVIVEDKISTSG